MLRALACDYDGTIASQDRIDPAALDALIRAREAGLRLILVTGRTFFELTRVCERLDLFDAVVAENGAVIYRPGVGTIRDQAPPPPPRLLVELDRRGFPTSSAGSSSRRRGLTRRTSVPRSTRSA